MPFGIPKSGFWGKIELAYQHCHMFYGFWFSLFVIKITGSAWGCLAGIALGVVMEIIQYRKYIKAMVMPDSWLDCIRDLCFWFIGGMLVWLIL